MNAFDRRRIATTIASILFAFYAGWNVWWLSLNRVPPAMLLAATGLPSPTTGGTRSFFAMMNGDVTLSLYHNVATFPIIMLLAVTLMFVVRRGTRRSGLGDGGANCCYSLSWRRSYQHSSWRSDRHAQRFASGRYQRTVRGKGVNHAVLIFACCRPSLTQQLQVRNAW